MKRLMVVALMAFVVLLSLPAMGNAESADSTHGRFSAAFAIGAGFPTSPNGAQNLNTGLVKKSMFLYKFSDFIKIGGVYGGSDFNASSLTDTDLQEYGGIAILHTMLSEQFGAFFKVQITSQTFNGGPAELGQMTGLGFYWKPDPDVKLVPFVGLDLIPVDIATKTNAVTLYGGVEVMSLF